MENYIKESSLLLVNLMADFMENDIGGGYVCREKVLSLTVLGKFTPLQSHSP